MNAQPFKLIAGVANGHFYLDATTLAVQRLPDGRYRLAPGSSDTGLTVETLDETKDWISSCGLKDVVFDRRSELLAVVAAHAAVCPPPTPRTAEPEPVTLVAITGGYITSEGDYLVTRLDATAHRHLRWRVTDAPHAIMPQDVRTLRHARRAIRGRRRGRRTGA